MTVVEIGDHADERIRVMAMVQIHNSKIFCLGPSLGMIGDPTGAIRTREGKR
jgi:hypothetical protein